jgi:hypothetical protein
VAYWDKKLWKVFSEYVRRNGANKDGMNECYTCYTIKHWKQLHAGHFVTRTAKAVKFDEQNVKPQCPNCNAFQGGMSWAFGQRLDEEYGEGTAENLEAQRHSIIKRKPSDYQELISYYEEKLAEYK